MWKLWKEYNGAVKGTLEHSIDTRFFALKLSACDQLAADAARFSRLGDSDTAVYDQLLYLMGIYRQVGGLADMYADGSPTVMALLMGICEVLNSRLKEFEDITNLEPNVGKGAETPETSENPVTREKRTIIEGALAYTTKRINDQGLSFGSENMRGENQVWDETFDEKLSECFRETYNHYREGLRFCLAGLDDLHARKAARLYSDLLKREFEELENIIRVQVRALEDTPIENAVHVGLPEDEPIVSRVLDLLREAYQQTGPVVNELLHTPESNPEPYRTFEEFTEGLLSAIKSEVSKPRDAEEFYQKLEAETYALFDELRVNYLKAAYRLQLIISGDILLADEISEAFKKVLGEIEDLNEGLEEDEDNIEHDIQIGIAETISIKIDSLKESTQSFNKQGMALLKAFSAEKTDAPEEERKAAVKEVRALWMENPPERAGLDAFFEQCLQGEIFAPYREAVEKARNEYFNKAEKAALRFKKEVLLYEICTYEEILTHSASRLRESAQEVPRKAAGLLDDAFRALEVILKKNNISIIRPLPHEPFNAKEHEVLVAEHHEGFSKGEIIKIMTAGYRHKEQIIIRANVIAAR